MLEYTLLLSAVEKSCILITKFVSAVSNATKASGKAKEYIQTSKEKERLKILLGKVQAERYGQAPLPWLLRRTYKSRSLKNWEQVQRSLASLQENVVQILELLEGEKGDFVIESRDAYESLLFGMKDRKKLFDAMLKMPPPKTDEDFKCLLKLADIYINLIEHLKLADRAVAEYLSDGKSSSTLPEYLGLFNEYENWDGKYFLDNEN